MRAFIENSWEALKVLRHELAADLRLAAEETRRWLPVHLAGLHLETSVQASLATISSDVVQRRAAAASSLPRGQGWAGLQSR
jgi:hypothetical protein